MPKRHTAAQSQAVPNACGYFSKVLRTHRENFDTYHAHVHYKEHLCFCWHMVVATWLETQQPFAPKPQGWTSVVQWTQATNLDTFLSFEHRTFRLCPEQLFETSDHTFPASNSWAERGYRHMHQYLTFRDPSCERSAGASTSPNNPNQRRLRLGLQRRKFYKLQTGGESPLVTNHFTKSSRSKRLMSSVAVSSHPCDLYTRYQ